MADSIDGGVLERRSPLQFTGKHDFFFNKCTFIDRDQNFGFPVRERLGRQLKNLNLNTILSF